MSYKDALSIVRSLEPIRTGNLRWNATYAIDLGNGEYDVIIDDKIAPYVWALNNEWEAKPKPEGLKQYTGLFTERIPDALKTFIASNVQERRETALASKQAIIKTSEDSPARQAMFTKYVGAD